MERAQSLLDIKGNENYGKIFCSCGAFTIFDAKCLDWIFPTENGYNVYYTIYRNLLLRASMSRNKLQITDAVERYVVHCKHCEPYENACYRCWECSFPKRL